MNKRAWFFVVGILVILAAGVYGVVSLVRDVTESALRPVSDTTNSLATQIAQVLHPTPTVMPDPITIVHEVRAIARLETVQYTVERVITAEIGQGPLAALFGDKLLFVAHGTVIAGVDLEKLSPDHLELKNGVLYVTLPKAEVFISAVDNEKSYVYDRDTGLLTKGDVNLESAARAEAERAIQDSAEEDGILAIAQKNAENYFGVLFRELGYPDVIFIKE